MKKKPEACNDKVLAHTVKVLKEDQQIVKDITSHYFEFIAITIKRGAFESVEIPYFGKFRAKLRYVQQINWHRSFPVPQKPKEQNDDGVS